MRAIRFNHLSISARNMEESVRFYEEQGVDIPADLLPEGAESADE
jgi:catechol 2,3-dioxygenase-like lactoylglutathione lyase family enzyme